MVPWSELEPDRLNRLLALEFRIHIGFRFA